MFHLIACQLSYDPSSPQPWTDFLLSFHFQPLTSFSIPNRPELVLESSGLLQSCPICRSICAQPITSTALQHLKPTRTTIAQDGEHKSSHQRHTTTRLPASHWPSGVKLASQLRSHASFINLCKSFFCVSEDPPSSIPSVRPFCSICRGLHAWEVKPGTTKRMSRGQRPRKSVQRLPIELFLPRDRRSCGMHRRRSVSTGLGTGEDPISSFEPSWSTWNFSLRS